MSIVRKHSPLTHRALGFRGFQVLAYVQDQIEHAGRAPTYAMIRDALGMTCKADVCNVVRRLERRGLLSRVSNGKVRRSTGWYNPVIRLMS